MTDTPTAKPELVEGTPVLELQDLKVSYVTRAGEIEVLPGLSFSLQRGEALGLVGESGCGKSTAAYAAIRHLGRAGRVRNGKVLFQGTSLYDLPDEELRRLRGNRIAMVYQDPMSSLNPTLTIGRQLTEVVEIHGLYEGEAARVRAVEMLTEVKLPDPERMMDRYPHQLSGGQQQRVVIAMALMAEPALLILDEPTTGLDVTVEAAVLDLIRELRRKHDAAIVFISHNLGTVVRICDRIGVMYAGELVEEGPIEAVFDDPRHPYTRGLLCCVPTLDADKTSVRLEPIKGMVKVPRNRPAECVFLARCNHAQAGVCDADRVAMRMVDSGQRHTARCARFEDLPALARSPADLDFSADETGDGHVLRVEDLRKTYEQRRTGFLRSKAMEVKALDGLTFDADRGRTLAIVGESGCGKSTLAKVLTGLEVATEGTVSLDGVSLEALAVDKRSDSVIRSLQMVFQNPDSTLNPSHSVGYAIERPLRRLSGMKPEGARKLVADLMAAVNLPAEFLRRKPRQLSGGQKQRVAIARALAGNPDVIIADEPVSALDVSVQAAIINLLATLQADRSTTLLFISHDLAVVRYLADRVLVMYLGQIMEIGTTEEVFAPPYHPYTEALLSAVPVPDPQAKQTRIVLDGKAPSVLDRPKGCPFSGRCPRRVGPICEETQPPEQETDTGHRIACHIPLAELAAVGPVIQYDREDSSAA